MSTIHRGSTARLTMNFQYYSIITETINEGLPLAAWSTVGNRSRPIAERLDLVYTLIVIQVSLPPVECWPKADKLAVLLWHPPLGDHDRPRARILRLLRPRTSPLGNGSISSNLSVQWICQHPRGRRVPRHSIAGLPRCSPRHFERQDVSANHARIGVDVDRSSFGIRSDHSDVRDHSTHLRVSLLPSFIRCTIDDLVLAVSSLRSLDLATSSTSRARNYASETTRLDALTGSPFDRSRYFSFFWSQTSC